MSLIGYSCGTEVLRNVFINIFNTVMFLKETERDYKIHSRALYIVKKKMIINH